MQVFGVSGERGSRESVQAGAECKDDARGAASHAAYSGGHRDCQHQQQ